MKIHSVIHKSYGSHKNLENNSIEYLSTCILHTIFLYKYSTLSKYSYHYDFIYNNKKYGFHINKLIYKKIK